MNAHFLTVRILKIHPKITSERPMIFSIYESFMQSAKIAKPHSRLVLRHSLRGDSRKGEVGLDVLLTREGEVLARHFGRHCDFEITRLATSPISRCVQTAECIANGYSEAHRTPPPIEPSEVLSQSYISDLPAAQELFRCHSPYEIMSAFLKGENLPGMRDLQTSMQILLGYLFSGEGRGLEVFITHDTFLLGLVCFCHGIYELEGKTLWPYMLEGAFLSYDPAKAYVSCIFRGVEGGRHFRIEDERRDA